MTLTKRLEALKIEYSRAKKQHRPRNCLAREMSHVMVKLIKREINQEKREARDAHS